MATVVKADDGDGRQGEDFYSLDNRRLYALRLYQRAHERHGIKDKLARA